MNLKVEPQGPCLSKLHITIPAADVNQAFDRALRGVAKKAEMPGYRAGKVPRSLIERQYSQQIVQEAVDGIVKGSLFAAIEQAGLAAVAMPTLDFTPPVRGQDFIYSADVEVQPTIDLVKISGLSVPPLDDQVDPKGVASALEQMRNQAAQTVPVTDRTAVALGDFVLLDYAGSIDGEPFPGGTASNALVEVVEGEYIPGFAEGLVGGEVPGTKSVPVSFPGDYGAAHLAGKSAVFQMNLKELKHKQLPELDDEFAIDMGEASLKALKTAIGERLATQAKRDGENRRRRALLTALIAANPFEVPPSMVDNQVERIISDTTERMARMAGRKSQLGADELADIRSSSRDDAEFQVRSGMLLMAVAKKLELAIADDAIDGEISRLATEQPEQAEPIRQRYAAADGREELRFRLLEERIVAHLYAESVQPEA